MDVGEALYIYMGTVARSCGEATFAALLKVYPLLRRVGATGWAQFQLLYSPGPNAALGPGGPRSYQLTRGTNLRIGSSTACRTHRPPRESA